MTQHTNSQTLQTGKNINTGSLLPRQSTGPDEIGTQLVYSLYAKIQLLETINNNLERWANIATSMNTALHKEFLQKNHHMLEVLRSYSQEIIQLRETWLATHHTDNTNSPLPKHDMLYELEKNMSSLNKVIEHLGSRGLQQITDLLNSNDILTQNLQIIKANQERILQSWEQDKLEAKKVPLLEAQLRKQDEVIKAIYEEIEAQKILPGARDSATIINPSNNYNSSLAGVLPFPVVDYPLGGQVPLGVHCLYESRLLPLMPMTDNIEINNENSFSSPDIEIGSYNPEEQSPFFLDYTGDSPNTPLDLTFD